MEKSPKNAKDLPLRLSLVDVFSSLDIKSGPDVDVSDHITTLALRSHALECFESRNNFAQMPSHPTHGLQQAKCAHPWSSMDGSDRVRVCSVCNQKVYSPDGLDEYQLLEVIRSDLGRSVEDLKLHRRMDGTIMLAPHRIPAGVIFKKLFVVLAIGTGVTVVLIGVVVVLLVVWVAWLLLHLYF